VILGLDAYKLKWIAIIGMILNHVIFALFEVLPVWSLFPLYAVGGLTFPIMGYFVVEGYRHTSNLKRYLLRLFIFGAVSIPFHILVFRGGFGMSILFTIILSILILVMYDKIKIRPLFWLIFVVLMVGTFIFVFDWFIIGPVVVLLYHVIGKESTRRIVPSVVAGASWLALSLISMAGMAAMQAKHGAEAYMEGIPAAWTDMNVLIASTTFGIGCIGAAFLIKGFNGERGKRMKWLFYAFYPLHLAALAAVALALGLIDFSLLGL